MYVRIYIYVCHQSLSISILLIYPTIKSSNSIIIYYYHNIILVHGDPTNNNSIFIIIIFSLPALACKYHYIIHNHHLHFLYISPYRILVTIPVILEPSHSIQIIPISNPPPHQRYIFIYISTRII